MTTLGLWVDESERGSLLAIGGVLMEWNAVPATVARWRSMKVKLGLKPSAEVKWSLPSDHPTRRALQRSKRTTRDLSAEAIGFLASSEMCFVVVVMFEQRQMHLWRILWPKASVRDFYCEGFRYLLQRAAEEVVETGAAGCVVVCDTPELGSKEFRRGSIKRGRRAVEQAYAEWYSLGVGEGPGRLGRGGVLRSIGFHPSILVGDATYHDMLQMADVVVGATRDWVASITGGKPDPWVTRQMKLLVSRFRQKHGQPSFWGDGLVIWPWQNQLWWALKKNLEG